MKGRRIDLIEEPKEAKTKKAEAKEATKSMTANEFLNSVGLIPSDKAPTNKAKNGVRTLVPSEKMRTMVDEIVVWKETEKEAKAERETREGQLIDWVQEKQFEEGFNNDYQKSYYVSGIENTVTFVSADRFSGPQPEDIPELQNVLGEKFGEFVSQEVTVNLKSSVLSDRVLLKELQDYIPKDQFGKFFEAQTKWSAVDGFDKKRFTLPKRIFEKVINIIKQSKPSIK